jgi:GDPmannose 4,6-dehydratase
MSKEVHLGNLDARRDWGHAADYVQAMHLMLKQSEPGDYVIATGETHSVREFCEVAFSSVGLDYQKYVKVDPIMYRPAEVDLLLGDASKALRLLGWKPRRLFTDLVKEMVQADLSALENSVSGAGLTTRVKP